MQLPLDTIIQGDALEVLKTLPSESIDCCITSPPYWGLRDYGTATWEGGELNCDHIQKIGSAQGSAGNTLGRDATHPQRASLPPTGHALIKTQYRDTCKKCGAKRRDMQLGLEPDFRDYISKLCTIFDEVKRVLKPEGTCWVNLGDTYRDKSLVQVPARFSIAMADRGWILPNEIIWHKPNCMPFSGNSRFTVDFEKVFFFAKSSKPILWRHGLTTEWVKAKPDLFGILERDFFINDDGEKETYWESHCYYFEQQLEPQHPDGRTATSVHARDFSIQHRNGERWPNPLGRNKRAVWTIATKPFKDAHFAVFPEELVETPVKAGCPSFGIVLDPFMGAGTTALVAQKLVRHYIGIELSEAYIQIANRRLAQKTIFAA